MVGIIGNSSPWRIKKGAHLDNVESILKENYLANGTQKDKHQLRRFYKALSPNVCFLCMESGETVEKHWIIFSYIVCWLWGYGIDCSN